MHNLAIALKNNGHDVTGSDDHLFDPSKTRLQEAGLLPNSEGWNPDLITADIDKIILGMHAQKDNPELKRAQELNLSVVSFPEFIYEASIDKKRIVIGGSHGKTTITSMILHCLNKLDFKFDYLVGAKIAEFDTMVKLSDAPVIILEGDEYLSSPLDSSPKFHWYKPHVALISGIAWDHANVYPDLEKYEGAFEKFLHLIEDGGTLIYFEDDPAVKIMAKFLKRSVKCLPYSSPDYSVAGDKTYIATSKGDIEISVFGEHNMQNLQAANMICQELGIDEETFYEVIQSFTGASNRLEKITSNVHRTVYKDFAHSPSKVRATVEACKSQFADRNLVACLELHTYSSLNINFLEQYAGSLDQADVSLVYFNPDVVAHKKLPAITTEYVKESFQNDDLEVFTSSDELKNKLEKMDSSKSNLLIMSSGNFDNLDLVSIAENWVS